MSQLYEIPISRNEQALIQRSPFISDGMNYVIQRIQNLDVQHNVSSTTSLLTEAKNVPAGHWKSMLAL